MNVINKYDTINFEFETALDDSINGSFEAAVIIINGRKLSDIIKPIEEQFFGCNEANLVLGYGNLPTKYLYNILREAVIPGEYANKYGAFLNCCAECREPGCCSVSVFIKETDNTVVWKSLKSEHRQIDYSSITPFVFDRESYWKAVEKLNKV